MAESLRRLWSIDELAEFLGVPVGTVYRWRYIGIGPRGIKVGKHVRYRPADVEVWLEEQAAATAQPAPPAA